MVLNAPPEVVCGEVFNIGSGEHRTILSIAQNLIELMCPDNPPSIIEVGDRPGQVLRHTADNKKIEAVLGWKPRTEWNDGLRKPSIGIKTMYNGGKSTFGCVKYLL